MDGKQLTDEQYEELQRQKRLEKQKIQEESARLSRQLGAAYAALKEHLRLNPNSTQQITDERAVDPQIYMNLRQNLERADKAPRCNWLKEDGTVCRSPRLKDDIQSYAHYQMRESRAKKLEIAAVADANGIQMAIMQIQRALTDDEISEKKAGLLLYSIQIAAANVDKTTFGQAKDEDMVTEVVELEDRMKQFKQETEEARRTEDIRKGRNLPLIHTDDTDRKTGEQDIPLIHTDDTDQERLGRMLPQSAGGGGAAGGAEIYANRGPGAEPHANLG